jgi:hypothetical protein
MAITKSTLLSRGRKRIAVDIDGDQIWVKELSVADAQALNGQQADEITLTAKLIARSVCDESGTLLFSDEDIEAIKSEMSLTTLKVIGEAAAKLNGFESPTIEDAKKK